MDAIDKIHIHENGLDNEDREKRRMGDDNENENYLRFQTLEITFKNLIATVNLYQFLSLQRKYSR